ncbi:nucleotidyltransferase family protein [Candidatus Marinimicrobia bacterium]|nr:nucleotidyltransferase family protein [Candidatus Neomarinimicrobiota bacterium]
MNKTKNIISGIDTVILVGGLGTRLQPVLKDKSKCLAPINGIPFIDILLDSCIKQGLRRFIICIGYLKEQVIEHLSNRNDCELVFSEEDTPLGTGGALKNAEPHIKSDPVFVMNGDSYCEIEYLKFLNYFYDTASTFSIVLSEQREASRYGNIMVDESQKIVSFSEKIISNHNKLINAGIYLLKKSILSYIPAGKPISLEHDIFPKMVRNTIGYGFPSRGVFFDIGTPESYKKRHNYFDTILDTK